MNRDAPTVRANLRVGMPDGARLATDVYLPASGEPAAAVLLRTPYGKGAHLQEGLGWAARGFAFVAQDVRGRYDSEGAFQPYRHERADGAAAVGWVAEQSWSSGEVVPAGGSYAAFTAWAAALGGHPAIRAVISLVPAMGVGCHAGPSGILYLASAVRWWVENGGGRTRRDGLFDAMYRADPAALAHLPVSELATRLWADLPAWRELVSGCPDPDQTIDDGELAALPVPAMHVGGWYDGFLSRTLGHWELAGSAHDPRPERALVVGPWTHQLECEAPARFGQRAHGAASRLALGAAQVGWLRHVLGGHASAEPAARVFVMGADRWTAAHDWPASPVASHAWYAGAGGTLRDGGPGAGGSDHFDYDPLDPFPSRSAPVDRPDLNRRADAVRYITAPLPEPLEILGAPVLVLHAATDAPATDWVGRLLELFPDGRMLQITHGAADASHGGAPGVAACWRVLLGPTAIVVPAGHRLCLEISSSDFPEYARNLNTGKDRYTTSATRIARQTVFYGRRRPTALVLPTAPWCSGSTQLSSVYGGKLKVKTSGAWRRCRIPAYTEENCTVTARVRPWPVRGGG